MNKGLLVSINAFGLVCSGAALYMNLNAGDQAGALFNFFFFALNGYFLLQNLGR